MDRQPVSPSTQLQREISNSESRPANISPPSSSPHSLKRKRTPISEEPPVTADFIPLDFGDASEEGEAIEKTPNNSISRAPAPSNTTPSPSPSSLSSPSSPENAEPNMGSADGETSSKDQSKKRTRRKKSKSESEAKVSKKAARKDASESAESQTKITPQITDKSNANSDREAGEITDSESESERIDAAARRRTEARLKAVPVLRKQPPPPESSSDESDVSKSALRSSAPKDGTSRAPSPEKTEQEIRNATRRALKKERRRVRRKLERDNRRAKAAAEHPKGGTFSNMPEASDESEAPKSPKASGKKDEFLEHRYYTAYAMPDLYAEEERPMFANTRPNIRSEVIKASKPPPAAPATNVCSICVKPGHSTPSCPALTCTHCSAHGTHFSHACPTLSPRSPPELDWRAIPSHRLTPLTSPPLPPLRATCYNCGATGHYGDDCPLVRPPDDGYGSFSLRDIAARGYAPRDELEDLEEHKELISNADGRRNHMRYAEAAEAGELGMPYDPYAAHKLTPALPAPPPTHESKGYSGGGGMSRSNGYRGPPERRDGGGGGRGGSRYGDSRRGGGGGGGGGGRGGGGGGGSRRGGGDAYRPSGYAGRGAWNQFNR